MQRIACIIVLILISFSTGCVQNKLVLKKKGMQLYDNKEYKKSKKVFEKVLRIDEEDPQVYFYLGRIYMNLDKLDKASKAFSRSIQLKPDYSDSFSNLGLIAIMKADFSNALNFLRNAVLYNPRDISAWNNIGFIYLQKKDYAQAIHYYRKSFEIEQDDPVANLNLAELYRKVLLDNDKAIFHYDKYLATVSSETAEAMEIRAWIQQIQETKGTLSTESPTIIDDGQSEKDETADDISSRQSNLTLEKTVRSTEEKEGLSQNDAANLTSMLAMGENTYVKAVEILEKQLELEPSKVELHEQLALVYLRLGLLQKAVHELKIARKLGLTNPEVIHLHDSLSAICDEEAF